MPLQMPLKGWYIEKIKWGTLTGLEKQLSTKNFRYLLNKIQKKYSIEQISGNNGTTLKHFRSSLSILDRLDH